MKLLRLLPFLLLVIPSALEATVRLGRDVLPVAQTVRLDLDPRSEDYSGSVAIDLDVKNATSLFRFHAVDLTIDTLELTRDGQSIDATHVAGEDGTVVVTTAEPLEPGRHALAITFTNRYNRQAVGLYKMTTRDGEPYLFTQFQAIDGRRAFPMWDEPGVKIPYEVTVRIPAEYDAVGNTPVAESSADETSKTIRFARTKPLPSYLLALAVGRFDFTPIEGMSIPGRVIAPKGQGHLTGFAVETTPSILAALETWFGSRYPFEKLDLIAVPEFWAGAMENPGAITFRDTILLLDPATTTPGQRQSQIRTNAHELAHMWFGDLVTMEWWDDFWLNESFADWMGDKITHLLHPEFEHDLDEMQSIQWVMNLDARASTDPVRNPGTSPEESMRNVGLAYNKGKAILSMFEGWIGPERFRQGVLAHMKSHAWGNADAAKFFASLGKHAPEGTAAALSSFISQPGVPLVTVETTGRSQIRISQSRFSSGAAVAPMTWRIPVVLRYSDGKVVRTASILLDTPSKTMKLEGSRIEWIFPHGNGSGYYRWKTTPEAVRALAGQASTVLTPRERLAFLGNLGALFRSGTIHGDLHLDLLGRFAADPHPQILSTGLGALSHVRSTFDSDATRPLLAAWIRRALDSALQRIGFTPRDDEPQSVTMLRPSLLTWLADAGDDERVWAFVAEQHAKYMEDASSLHPSLAGVVVGLAAKRGDAALFEEYRKRFEEAVLPADRSRYLSGLGQFADPALKRRARDYALTGPVRANELFALFGAASTAAERDELYGWVTDNYGTITKRLPPAFAAGMPSIAGGCEPERVERARTFFAEHRVDGTERQLDRVAEQVMECATLREREMKAVLAYLREE